MTELPNLETTGNKTRTLELSEPVIHGKAENTETISQIVIRKPDGSALRGLSVNAIAAGDVDQLAILIPRITTPMITTDDVYAMPYDDIASISGVLIDFLQKSKAKLVTRSLN